MMTGAIALLTLCNSCALVPSPRTKALSTTWPEPVSQSEGDRSPFLPKRLPQDPQIQVYFNHTPTAAFTDPYRRIRRPGDDLEALIAAQINQATRSVDVAVQELRLPRIAEALVNRHRAGVRVRVIVENQYRQPWSAYSPEALEQLPSRERSRIRGYQKLGDRDGDQVVSPEEADRMDTMRMLARGQVPVIDDRADGSKGSGLMHHKFVVVDGQRVLTGSANFTPSDTFGDVGRPHTLGNPNHLLVISSSTVAGWFQEEFELMWGDGPGGEPDSQFGRQKPFRSPRTIRLGNSQLTVHFAPAPGAIALRDTTTGTIATALDTVQKQADLALFVFSDQHLANRLLLARQRGAQIRLLIDTGFAFRYYSEGLDLAGVARPNRECEVEAGNRVWGLRRFRILEFLSSPRKICYIISLRCWLGGW